MAVIGQRESSTAPLSRFRKAANHEPKPGPGFSYTEILLPQAPVELEAPTFAALAPPCAGIVSKCTSNNSELVPPTFDPDSNRNSYHSVFSFSPSNPSIRYAGSAYYEFEEDDDPALAEPSLSHSSSREFELAETVGDFLNGREKASLRLAGRTAEDEHEYEPRGRSLTRRPARNVKRQTKPESLQLQYWSPDGIGRISSASKGQFWDSNDANRSSNALGITSSSKANGSSSIASSSKSSGLKSSTTSGITRSTTVRTTISDFSLYDALYTLAPPLPAHLQANPCRPVPIPLGEIELIDLSGFALPSQGDQETIFDKRVKMYHDFLQTQSNLEESGQGSARSWIWAIVENVKNLWEKARGILGDFRPGKKYYRDCDVTKMLRRKPQYKEDDEEQGEERGMGVEGEPNLRLVGIA